MLHGPPTAAELVEAVGEFLEREVLPATAGALRFHVRVARNVLGVVERELALGAAQEAAHSARLAGLGVADDEELAVAIRAGGLDDRFEELVAVLRADVADRLAVASPSYGAGS